MTGQLLLVLGSVMMILAVIGGVVGGIMLVKAKKHLRNQLDEEYGEVQQ